MRRSAIPAVVLLLSLPLPLLAQHNHAAMTPTAATAASAAKADAMSEGVVKKIDRKAGRITIAHGPLTNLGMGSMTMTFRLKSADLADGVNEGSRVQFVAENVNNELVVVALKAAK